MDTLRGRILADFSELVASRDVAPASGAVTAYMVELAAALVVKAANGSADWDEAEGIAAQASALRRRAAPLPDRSAASFASAVKALRARGSDEDLGARLTEATDVPLAVLDLAVSVAELAALVADRGDPDHRPEAVGACVLADGAAAQCAHLVAINLGNLADDARTLRAAALAADVADVRARLLRN